MKTSLASLLNNKKPLVIAIITLIGSIICTGMDKAYKLTPLEASIIAHEGVSAFPYMDTEGNLTIGIGKNIDRSSNMGLQFDEMLLLLRNDIDDCIRELRVHKFYRIQDSVRKDVLIELCYNMGTPKLLTFKRMRGALLEQDYIKAAHELLDSRWALQVGKKRSLNLAERLLNGQYFN